MIQATEMTREGRAAAQRFALEDELAALRTERLHVARVAAGLRPDAPASARRELDAFDAAAADRIELLETLLDVPTGEGD